MKKRKRRGNPHMEPGLHSGVMPSEIRHIRNQTAFEDDSLYERMESMRKKSKEKTKDNKNQKER